MFAGRHQSLPVWVGCLYLMGLNQSKRQIAKDLGLSEGDVQHMSEQLRQGIVAAQNAQADTASEPQLSGQVEFDEAYVVAGHKGQPQEVKKRPPSAKAALEGCTRTRHAGQGKAPHLWDD